MPRLRKLLIVSPHFPPVNAPDMQRVRMSLPYYREFGWEPVVLTVDEAYQNAARDEELVATVPPEINVVRCRALSPTKARRFGLGDLGLRAWPYLRETGSRLIKDERIDLVFFSNTQFTTFPLGRLWQSRHGVPYVIDLQDPWRTDYYERRDVRRPPGGWKYQLARLQAVLLEEWSLRRAGGMMSVSEDYLAALRARYPWFRHVPQQVIRFGASERDLQEARASGGGFTERSNSSDCLIRFVYTGAAGPIMPHAAAVLFGALRHYRERFPERAARLRLAFFGTSYDAPDRAQATLLPLAREHGVDELVEEIPQRLGHLEALRRQAAADVLLLLGSSDRAYSPSKLYPYYLARRPMLSLVFRGSLLENLVETLDCSRIIRFDESSPREPTFAALSQVFDDALAGFPPGTLPARNDAYFQQHFLARELTRQQCALFEIAAPSNTRDAPS